MENTAFILYEKFCPTAKGNSAQGTVFKKAFERYLTDALQNDTPIPLQDGHRRRAIKMLCRDTCAGNKGRRP